MNLNIYPIKRKKIRFKRRRKSVFLLPFVFFLCVCIALTVTLGFKYFGKNTEAHTNLDPPRIRTKDNLPPNLQSTAEKAPRKQSEQEDKKKIISKMVQPGETATAILGEYFTTSQIYSLSQKSESIHPLRNIKSGHKYYFHKIDDRISKFVYEINKEKKLCVDFQKKGYKIAKKDIEYEKKTKLVKGRIESSLFKAVDNCGESSRLALKLASIFAWDIDFIKDLRENDSFELIVEKKFRKGNFYSYGKILAAQFVNQGDTYRAFLYSQEGSSSDYFRANGQAVRKNFLKAPLNYSRISSSYTWKRKHPILDKVRPHLGIDYAAPRGTPIESVADGEIITRSYAQGAGNYLKIRHKNGYVTVYNHMSSYARGIKEEKHVDQGETIGFVGSTGLATGPHLDYRVKKYGKYINPLQIESKPVEPIPEKKIKEFKKSIKPLLAVLKGKKPLYALNKSTEKKSEEL